MVVEYIVSCLTLVTVVLLFYFYRKQTKHHNPNGKESAYVALWWICIFIFGCLLYFIAQIKSFKPEDQTTFSFILNAIASSFAKSLKMFGFDFDFQAVRAIAIGTQVNNYLFCAAYIVCFFAACLWTIIMAKNIFLKGIGNSVNVFFHRNKGWFSKFFKNKQMTVHYIVIGCEKEARIFLTSLTKKVKKSNITVITGTTSDGKEKELYKDLIETGYTTLLGKVDSTILEKAGIINNNCKTIIIAMSEKDEENLAVAQYVTDYIKKKINPYKMHNSGRIKELNDNQKQSLRELNLSAYIMYGFLERAEHFSFSDYALGRVHFFNPYEVRARKFLFDFPLTKLIPNEWINTNKARLKNAGEREGEVQRPYSISNIFIGFGKSNKQILKKSVCFNQLLGVDYNALIIDKDIEKCEKRFKNDAVGLFDSVDSKGDIIAYGSELLSNPNRNKYFESPKEKNNIRFINKDALATDFYDAVVEEVRGNDFVQIVIALGDEKLSIETALELRQKLYERELLKIKSAANELDRVKIFVKIKEKSILTEESVLNDEHDIDSKIISFGANDEILTSDYIINEKLDVIAEKLVNNYLETSRANHDKELPKSNIFTKWDALTHFKRDSNRDSALSIKMKLNLLGFDLVESDTKTDNKIWDEYYNKYDNEVAKKQREQKNNGKFVDFIERDENGVIIDNARNNLAMQEHQRWNAFHIVNGWTKFEIAKVDAETRQDEKAKQHACLTTFDGLTKLRKKQAEAALLIAKEKGNRLTRDEVLSEADTICYDFDLMDFLATTLRNSGFKITILGECP